MRSAVAFAWIWVAAWCFPGAALAQEDESETRSESEAVAPDDANAKLKVASPTDGEDDELEWGVGSDNVAVFHNISYEVEQARLDATRAWQQRKFDAGYAMINWPEALGGRGLPNTYVRAYNTEENKFDTPSAGELPPTSMGLIAPTIAVRSWM